MLMWTVNISHNLPLYLNVSEYIRTHICVCIWLRVCVYTCTIYIWWFSISNNYMYYYSSANFYLFIIFTFINDIGSIIKICAKSMYHYKCSLYFKFIFTHQRYTIYTKNLSFVKDFKLKQSPLQGRKLSIYCGVSATLISK